MVQVFILWQYIDGQYRGTSSNLLQCMIVLFSTWKIICVGVPAWRSLTWYTLSMHQAKPSVLVLEDILARQNEPSAIAELTPRSLILTPCLRLMCTQSQVPNPMEYRSGFTATRFVHLHRYVYTKRWWYLIGLTWPAPGGLNYQLARKGLGCKTFTHFKKYMYTTLILWVFTKFFYTLFFKLMAV